MARRIYMGDLLHGEGIKIYFTHIQRYHEALEDVVSL